MALEPGLRARIEEAYLQYLLKARDDRENALMFVVYFLEPLIERILNNEEDLCPPRYRQRSTTSADG